MRTSMTRPRLAELFPDVKWNAEDASTSDDYYTVFKSEDRDSIRMNAFVRDEVVFGVSINTNGMTGLGEVDVVFNDLSPIVEKLLPNLPNRQSWMEKTKNKVLTDCDTRNAEVETFHTQLQTVQHRLSKDGSECKLSMIIYLP